DLAIHHEALLQVHRLGVVADDLRLEHVALPRGERLAKGDGLTRDHRVEAVTHHELPHAGTVKQVEAAQIHQREVNAVVHVVVDVEVCGKHAKGQPADVVNVVARAPVALDPQQDGSKEHVHAATLDHGSSSPKFVVRAPQIQSITLAAWPSRRSCSTTSSHPSQTPKRCACGSATCANPSASVGASSSRSTG